LSLISALLLAASFKVQVLSFVSREELDRFVSGGAVTQLVLAHRGPIRPGQKTLFPIVARKVPPRAALVADFQVHASDGRLLINWPACCRAVGAAAAGSGILLLEPVPELTLLPSDLDGLYTATAVVRDQAGAQRKGKERVVLSQ
jgi:hypothetical protein